MIALPPKAEVLLRTSYILDLPCIIRDPVVGSAAGRDCTDQLHRHRGRVGGPLVIGYLKDVTGSFTSGLLYVVAMLVMGIICIAIVAARTRVARSKVLGVRLARKYIRPPSSTNSLVALADE